jgi:hypothetical protein
MTPFPAFWSGLLRRNPSLAIDGALAAEGARQLAEFAYNRGIDEGRGAVEAELTGDAPDFARDAECDVAVRQLRELFGTDGKNVKQGKGGPK